MGANNSRGTNIFLGILAIPIMLWTVIPLLWIFALSFKDADSQSNNLDANILGNFFPKSPTMANYEDIFVGSGSAIFAPICWSPPTGPERNRCTGSPSSYSSMVPVVPVA